MVNNSSLPLHNETLKLLYATKAIMQGKNDRHVSNEVVVYIALADYFDKNKHPGDKKWTRKQKLK